MCEFGAQNILHKKTNSFEASSRECGGGNAAQTPYLNWLTNIKARIDFGVKIGVLVINIGAKAASNSFEGAYLSWTNNNPTSALSPRHLPTCGEEHSVYSPSSSDQSFVKQSKKCCVHAYLHNTQKSNQKPH